MNNNIMRDMDIRQYAVLVALVVAYGFYLFSYTLFDGFASFSNDAGSYVLMARKWSPYFAATPAEVFTWPVQAYPPAFALLLAVTGASESLWASHLVVSLCLLSSIFLMGRYTAVQSSYRIAILLVIAICLAPGAIIHSLGLLSENLYLLATLGALSTFVYMRNRQDISWVWYVVLFALLVLTMFTRTIGIALLGAFFFVPIFDRSLIPRQRILFPLLAMGGFTAWQIWDALNALPDMITYDEFFTKLLSLAREDVLSALAYVWNLVGANMVKLMASWGQYFVLKSAAIVSVVMAFLLFAISSMCLLLRVAKLKVDAVYLLFYVGILLIWPFPDEYTRFLHPVAFLILVQPVFFLAERGHLQRKVWAVRAVYGVALVLILHSAYIQYGMFNEQLQAKNDMPQLAHAPEYYLSTEENQRVNFARSYIRIAEQMKESGKIVPHNSIVAVTKHTNYTILADRKSVPLTSSVSLDQQLCNFQIANVDTVLLTGIYSMLNVLGPDLYSEYREFSSSEGSVTHESGEEHYIILKMDRGKILTHLALSGFTCQETRVLE